jgi:hypothetical protein
MLLVVLAIVLYIAMSNFKSVAPAAVEIQNHNKARRAGETVKPGSTEPNTAGTSASADTWNPSPPSRPSLSKMDQQTSAHTSDVQNALSQSN